MTVDVEWIEGDPPPTQGQIDNERLDAWFSVLKTKPGVWALRPDYGNPFEPMNRDDIEWTGGAGGIYYRAKPQRQRTGRSIDWTAYAFNVAVAAFVVVLAVAVVTLIVRAVAS